MADSTAAPTTTPRRRGTLRRAAHVFARMPRIALMGPAAAVGGQAVEQFASRVGGLVRHMIGGRPPFRMHERNQRMGKHIAADDQTVAA